MAQPPVLFVTRADGSARTPQASVPRRAPRRDRKPCQNRPCSPITNHTCVVHPTPSQAVPQLIAPTLPHRPIPCEACLQCHAACGKQPYKKCGRLCMKNHRSPVMHAYLKCTKVECHGTRKQKETPAARRHYPPPSSPSSPSSPLIYVMTKGATGPFPTPAWPRVTRNARKVAALSCIPYCVMRPHYPPSSPSSPLIYVMTKGANGASPTPTWPRVPLRVDRERR